MGASRLLKKYFLDARADVVCIQEAAGGSFADDFSFMMSAGYEHRLHRKFRFRNATFWRADRWFEEVSYHRDKVLVTTLRSRQTPARCLHVVNCHLTGGLAPARRLRQVFEGVDQVRKIVTKLKHEHEGEAVIVCGDFNTYPGESGVKKFLTRGVICPEDREADYPDESLTSRERRHPFGAFSDLHGDVYGAGRPPTLVVTQLRPLFVDATSGRLMPDFLRGLEKMFTAFANSVGELHASGIEAWAIEINREIGRGSEYRKAVAALEAKPEPFLTLEDFVTLYVTELEEGRFWAVHHDMAACGVALTPPRAPYQATLDYLYYNRRALEAVAVREPLSEAQRKKLFVEGESLPNEWHPSDHLPIAAAFKFIAER